MQQTPATVKWIQGLLIFKVCIGLVMFLASLYCAYAQPTDGFWGGFSDTLLKRVGGNSLAYAAGYFAGSFVMGTLMSVLQWFFLKRKKQTAFWIAFGAECLLGFAGGRLPLGNIPIFILGLLKPTKDYFTKKDDIQPPPYQ